MLNLPNQLFPPEHQFWNAQLKLGETQTRILSQQTKILDETRKVYFWLLLATFLMALIQVLNMMKVGGADQMWLEVFYLAIVSIGFCILVKLICIVLGGIKKG